MITKEGNALFNTALKGAKSFGKLFKPQAVKGVGKTVSSGAAKAPTGFKGKLKDFGKEYVSQSVWSSPFDALALAGGASAGSVVFGNLGGTIAGKALTPFTNKIRNKYLRGAANFVGTMGADTAAAITADKYLPIYRRKPVANQQPYTVRQYTQEYGHN